MGLLRIGLYRLFSSKLSSIFLVLAAVIGMNWYNNTSNFTKFCSQSIKACVEYNANVTIPNATKIYESTTLFQ